MQNVFEYIENSSGPSHLKRNMHILKSGVKKGTARSVEIVPYFMSMTKRIKKYLGIALFGILIVGVTGFVWPTTIGKVQAATVLSGGLHSKVQATVGEFYLNLSGFASPYASIILTVNGTVYRTAVADEMGNFSITGVLIRKGFSSFCLEHLDFKRIGESEACFNMAPATKSIDKKDIFLPPTIGLQRTQIAAGSDGVIFGYTMPGSQVTIHLKDGKEYIVQADSSGYYTLTLKNLKAGTYELFATAVYHQKPSEAPSHMIKLIALSWWQQFLNWLKDIITWLLQRYHDLGLGPLWLVFPLIPLVTYFVLRLWPERFTWITESRTLAFLFRRKERKLHHAWMFGY